MSWDPPDLVPIFRRYAAPGAPILQIFLGKPHALAFLADGSLVVGGSRELTVHDPAAPTPPRATFDLDGGVEWMTAHPDGVSVVAAVRNSRGSAVVRVWPAAGKIVRLFTAPSFGWMFIGNLSPDGTQLVWRRYGEPPTLHTVDVETGAELRELPLPQATMRAAALAVRPDGAVYINGEEGGHLVHPDGRVEACTHFDSFTAPFFVAGGGVMTINGRRFGPVEGKLEQFPGLKDSANGGSISHDRRHLTFHAARFVQVWDVLARSVIFSADRAALGGGWRGQAAAASATHVAAIEHLEATVAIWRIDQPAEPIAKLGGYGQGAGRLSFHGDSLTVKVLLPLHKQHMVTEIDLQSGAAQSLRVGQIHDFVRTRDGQRIVALREGYHQPIGVLHLDAAAAELEEIEVKANGGALALAPNDATWGFLGYRYTDREPSVQAQWRAFGATKWAKTVKGHSHWYALELCDTAAAVMIGPDLSVFPLGKSKPLLTTSIAVTPRALALSRDGAYVGLACDEGIRLVHVASGVITELKYGIGHEPHWPKCICFDERGVWVFVGFPNGAITQHRVATGALVAVLHGHNDDVRALAWHDGSLWSSSEDGTILRWGDLG
ncbi:hypothetical protein [Nannocystis punicea]|uniref:WD40 repeat n=1 Tax=Nannocystis punicea TaxID=2995304 RepID=A0ABY7H0F7_9BACT|nr:hypothetical protein [Nannocystis poenicansa]WAS92590.1 hypothetical protein O0S08_40945 [Nannocystis poenicansa]